MRITPSLSRLAERFEKCQRDAILFCCEQCGEGYAVPYSCCIIICEFCSRRMSRKIYRRYLSRIKHRQDLKHVTLARGSVENMTKALLRRVYRLFVKVLKPYWRSFVSVQGVSQGWSIPRPRSRSWEIRAPARALQESQGDPRETSGMDKQGSPEEAGATW